MDECRAPFISLLEVKYKWYYLQTKWVFTGTSGVEIKFEGEYFMTLYKRKVLSSDNGQVLK